MIKKIIGVLYLIIAYCKFETIISSIVIAMDLFHVSQNEFSIIIMSHSGVFYYTEGGLIQCKNHTQNFKDKNYHSIEEKILSLVGAQ